MGLLTILKKVKEEEREIRILVLGLDNAGKTTIVRRLCDKPIDSIEPTLGFSIQTLEYDLRDNCNNCSDDTNINTNTNNDEDATNTYVSTSTYQLHLWDIGGQSTIRAYWRNYFEKTDGIVWVVDSGDRRRMKLVKEELDTVLEQERLAGASLLVLANKSDLEGSLGPESIARALRLGRIESETPTTQHIKNYDHNHNDGNCGDSTATHNPAAAQDAIEIDSDSKPNHSSRHWTIKASSAVTGEGLAESIEWLVRDITDRIYFAA